MISQTNSSNQDEQVTTAEVLAEVERRMSSSSSSTSFTRGWQRKLVVLVNRFIFWLSRHWLAIFNALAFLYVGLPVLAPVLIHLGIKRPAMIIYAIYRPLCHQLPQRSWFLFGQQFAYTLPELRQLTGAEIGSGLRAGAFIGNQAMGYKVAFCQRDTAIYGAIFLFGLLYAVGRRRIRPLPWWGYLLGLLPMAADGGYQFLSIAISIFFPDFSAHPYESTPLKRTVTGAIFGLVTIWLAYPYVQETMDEFRATLHQRFGWE